MGINRNIWELQEYLGIGCIKLEFAKSQVGL